MLPGIVLVSLCTRWRVFLWRESSEVAKCCSRHGIQQGGDTVSECLDRAKTGQIEEGPILVLFDLSCHFEGSEDHRLA